MKRIIFLNRFFFPDHSATSQLVSDLAFNLVEKVPEVYVLTSQQLYENSHARLPARETIRGVKVHRVPTSQFGRSSLPGRVLDYVSFYGSVWRAMHNIAEKEDILIAKTDPPLLSLLAMQAAKKRGAHLVNWIQDIYPEVAVELGIPFFRGPISQTLASMRDSSLRHARANVVVGQRMAERLVSHGASSENVHVIHNWIDDEVITPVFESENPLRQSWGLANKFVIGYCGNLGRAHEFDTMLEAAAYLKDNFDIVFLFVGGGHKFEELIKRVRERGLDAQFKFFPYQSRDALRYLLSVPDVHWISLKPQVEGLIVPSKFYGIAAAGRPIIAVTAKDGEIAQLVLRHECGLVIEPGQARLLADLILELSTDPDRVRAMGTRARKMLEAKFTRMQALEKWWSVLEKLNLPKRPTNE